MEQQDLLPLRHTWGIPSAPGLVQVGCDLAAAATNARTLKVGWRRVRLARLETLPPFAEVEHRRFAQQVCRRRRQQY